MSEHEFIKWLGMRFVVVCDKEKWGRKYWWSKEDILIGKRYSFRLNEYMIHVRFEKILTRIKYIDEDPLNYVDRFFHVQKLVEACNANRSTKLIPGWISCFYESMMIWKNNFGPGWVVLPRNPHPFGR